MAEPRSQAFGVIQDLSEDISFLRAIEQHHRYLRRLAQGVHNY